MLRRAEIERMEGPTRLIKVVLPDDWLKEWLEDYTDFVDSEEPWTPRDILDAIEDGESKGENTIYLDEFDIDYLLTEFVIDRDTIRDSFKEDPGDWSEEDFEEHMDVFERHLDLLRKAS